MGEWIGYGRKARVTYGFDEIAIVPGRFTVDTELVDVSFDLAGFKFEIPILAAAMDGVVSPEFAIKMNKLGGFAVLNLDGIFTRYGDPYAQIDRIINAPSERVTQLLQEIYQEPVKEELIYECINKIKGAGGVACVSTIPHNANKYKRIVKETGCDILVIQGTVVTAKFFSSNIQQEELSFFKLKKELGIPIIVGNCVSYAAALDLLREEIDALLVGVGPGAACTTRSVLGIGVPQITAIIDVAAARDFYYKQSGRYVPIIADGGMLTGGDVCKAIAAGANGVMLGSALAKAREAPGKGYHWGMATPHRYLPRGTLIYTGTTSSLEEILWGPAHLDDGSQNLVGALKTAMGMCGAKNIREMHLAELIIAPSIKTEGKLYQQTKRDYSKKA